MNSRTPQIIIRLLVHVLLALFLANAANKFFVVDLEYELDHHFYGRIFLGAGDAPDQYRILPLLPLKLLCDHLPFNTAVLVYNSVFGFLVLELFWWIMGGIKRGHKFAFNALFAGTYIYAQYTGWRPDTMGLVFLTALVMSPFLVRPGNGLAVRLRFSGSSANENATNSGGFQDLSAVQILVITLLIAALSFARADIALVFALWFIIYGTRKASLALLWVVIPPLVQFVLQEMIYPDAEYYSDKVMLLDNLRGYYLLRHPATYLILGMFLAFWRPIRDFFRRTWDQKWFYGLLLGYLGLVLVIGRINEYRLYLPFVPIFLVIWRESTTQHEAQTDPI